MNFQFENELKIIKNDETPAVKKVLEHVPRLEEEKDIFPIIINRKSLIKKEEEEENKDQILKEMLDIIKEEMGINSNKKTEPSRLKILKKREQEQLKLKRELEALKINNEERKL